VIIFIDKKGVGIMSKQTFTKLAYDSVEDFLYGTSKIPVKCKNGLEIGGGKILPEINFTLPPMSVNEQTMPDVIKEYKSIIDEVCKRAKELYVPGLVVEIETLPPMTFNPEWGIEVTKTVRSIMYDYEQKYGLKSAMRITPNDIREGRGLEHMWRGQHWESMMKTFEGCAKEGADFLAIESVGGKDIHDEAIMICDIRKSLFALGFPGIKDMHKLWGSIVEIANRTGSIASGDTACGFGNTAMVLADRGYVPRVFAAVVRVMTAVRSLAALEEGAVGPHKDCGYEGVYVKAITGTPIAMEGKSSACAHLSPVGNIAAAVADLWSNESVQNIKLLGGMAPTVSLEQLAYDCRLMNTASDRGIETARLMRDLLTDSDSQLDPQAYVLRPDVVLKISEGIIKEEGSFNRIKAAAKLTLEELRKASAENKVMIKDRELVWLDTMSRQLDSIPDDEEEFLKDMLENEEFEKFDPKLYDYEV
jgi:methanol---5-hydroxybenzimidazolylcobamide Co-methyltransferase